MAHSVSFIGSFRKPDHYEIVRKAIKLFRENGIVVNSPKGSNISGSIEDFVIFDTDDKGLTPAEIQMITLDKILRSDMVYVCNLDGYVGRTTCYEIGFCLSRNIPLYFLSRPIDLPIPAPVDHIVSLEQLLSIALQNKECTIDPSCIGKCAQNAMLRIWPPVHTSTEPRSKRIVICGSMQFYNEMRECQKTLIANGIEAIIPKDEGDIPESISEEDFRAFKKKVSSAYLRKIREKETTAVLVFNEPKRGIDNYIGANTFVELAMAFSWNRKIYLLNDMYAPYIDELEAWDVICLKGDLNKLIASWNSNVRNPEGEYEQLTLDMYWR